VTENVFDQQDWLLDGATGTELARRGVDISGERWSADAAIHHATTLQQVHEAYLAAGAEGITTNTFRAHERAFHRAGRADELDEVIATSVHLARAARDRVNAQALILGSIGPLEDCYVPERAPSFRECFAEHSRAIERLLHAGVDLIVLETMGTAREAVAAARAAAAQAAGRWIVSCLGSSDAAPGVLLGGDSMRGVIETCDTAYAIGVNCVPAPHALAHVQWLRAHVAASTRVMAYANTGQMDEPGVWRNTDAVEPARYADYARHWRDAGANIIGGCCGTTPATIRALADMPRA